MTGQQFIPYAKQHISDADMESVRQALSGPTITRGPIVEQFERTFSDYCGASYSVAFNSGTAALMAAYYAADIGPGDQILTTPNTFISTVGSGIQRGATPIFIDIEKSTGNINVDHLTLNFLDSASRKKTAVVPVHLTGIPVDMQRIYQKIANERTIIIEDASHAIGSRYVSGEAVGSCIWSDMTVFSFHPAKTMTTGEGGMVTTNDEELYHRLRLYRNNGIENNPSFFTNQDSSVYPGFYEVNFLSGNYNFTEMQAALGLSQLKQIDQFIAKRKKLLNAYIKKLSTVEHIKIVQPKDNAFVAPHLCVALIDFAAYKTTRREVMEALSRKNIGTQVHYIPIYRHPFFNKNGTDMGEYFPEMESYYSQALTLPLFFDLELEDVAYITDELLSLLQVSAAHRHS